MRLWRISNYADLTGEGGLVSSARWHSRGRRIVYLTDHPASALLEVLVHLEVDVEDMPASYRLHAVEIDDSATTEDVPESALPAEWRQMPEATRAAGDDWIDAARTPLLRVPSAIVPFAWNWLLNPGHPGSTTARIVESFMVPYDPRLLV